MRTCLLAMAAAMVAGCGDKAPAKGPVGTATAEDPKEAKRRRIGEIVKETSAILAAGAPKREDEPRLKALNAERDAIFKELGLADAEAQKFLEAAALQYAPDAWKQLLAARLRAQETSAKAGLKTIVTAVSLAGANDDDGNGLRDFWVADVSGLHRMKPAGAALDAKRARADARPCVPLDKDGEFGGVKLSAVGTGAAANGYLFGAVQKRESEKGKFEAYADANGRNPIFFAFAAWPEKYGETGTQTFVVSQDGVIWWKDTKGVPPDVFPLEPKAEGWASDSR